jgi:5'-nucleotidase
MRILVTNDDGIHAPGLDVAAEIAQVLSDDVWVIAPELDQSGVSHSLSLNDPLRMREVSERRFAIKGTPTDCVIMAVRHILNGKAPDLILSGVNRGSNTGEDVTYSGTIAGAMEGTILGIPSVALSQAYGADTRLRPHWQTALRFAPDLIRKILEAGMPRDVLVNINFPDCLPDEVRGIAVTSQGRREQEWIRIEPRHDGRGIPYFWIAFTRGEQPSGMHGTDLSALADRRIAVTPLRVDMTDEPFMTRLAQVLE